MTSYPFRLYGDDTADWYEPPHPFEVQLSRAPDDAERKQMAAIWVARGPRRAAPWLWSGRFFLMHVDTGHYARSMSIARKVLTAVHELCPIVDVSCWGTRSGGGPWTAWSVGQQPRPDPGPDHPNLARDVLFWARDADPEVPPPIVDPVFKETMEALRKDDALTGLSTAVEKHSGLELVELHDDPPPPAPATPWPEEHAHHVDFSEPDPDVALGWSIPAVVRPLPGWKNRLTYVWKGEVHHAESGNDFRNSTFDEVSGRVWFAVRDSLHELVLETGEHRPVWKRERNDHSFWGTALVGTGEQRMLVVATAGRMVCFSVDAGGISPTSAKKRKYPSIHAVLGGRVLAVRGDAGLAFFIPVAGKLQQVLALPKAKAFVGARDPNRLHLHLAERTFELQGFVPLVEAKEAARDKKVTRKKKASGKKAKGKLTLEPIEAPAHTPHPGVPAGAFELPYASEAGAVYLVPMGGITCQLGHVDSKGKARLLRSKDFRVAGVAPSGRRAQAVTSTNLVSFDVGGTGKTIDQPLARAYDTVAIAGGDAQCVVVDGKRLQWFAFSELGEAELIALGKPSGTAPPSTPLLLEEAGALLLPRGEKGLEVYLRDQERIAKVAKVDTPVDSVVQDSTGVIAHHSQHGHAFRVEHLDAAIEAGRTKLERNRANGKLKPFPFPRSRPEALPVLEPVKSSIAGASIQQAQTIQGPDGTEVAFGGDAGRGGRPWLKVRRDGGEPTPLEGFEATWGNVRQLSTGASGHLYIAGGDGVFCLPWSDLGQGRWLVGIGAARGVAELGPDLLAVLQHQSLAVFARGDGGWSEVATRKLKMLDNIESLAGTQLCAVTERFRRTFVFRVEQSGDQTKVSPICEVDGAGALRGSDGRVYVDTGADDHVVEIVGAAIGHATADTGP